jgi:hypothetical protein
VFFAALRNATFVYSTTLRESNMSETNPIPNTIEQQKQPDAVAAAAFDWGIGTLLNAQADMLASTGAVMGDWLHRRREAVRDAGQLIARVHVGAEPAEAFRTQREFVSHFFQRLAAEVDAYQAATQHIMERAPHWLPQDGWFWFPRIAGSAETASSQAAATRAAGRPLRMANNKSD